MGQNLPNFLSRSGDIIFRRGQVDGRVVDVLAFWRGRLGSNPESVKLLQVATNAILHFVPWCNLRRWAPQTRFTLTGTISSVVKFCFAVRLTYLSQCFTFKTPFDNPVRVKQFVKVDR